MATVRDILHKAPHQPGVYLMKDARKTVFYVGKAKDLHNRMHQYINPAGDERAFVGLLDGLLASVEFFITTSEKEALILENVLIKKHQPRYNVAIKDDKNYFSLMLDLGKPYPRLQVVRRRKKNHALYFGPYSSARKAREMLKLVNKHFMLCDCSERAFSAAKRPCMRYQMGRCHAPCVLPVAPETYAKEVARVRMFLEGKKDLLLAELEPLMREASDAMDFERAAKIRDQIRAVVGSLERQVVDLSRDVNWDVIGWVREGELAHFALIRLRDGVIRSRETWPAECRAMPDAVAVGGFLQQYYQGENDLPDKLLVPVLPVDADALLEWLSEKHGKKVEMSVPARSAPARLMAMAEANARQAWNERRGKRAEVERTLKHLQKALGLKNLPKRIEAVDISTFQGRLSVGSLVCFIDAEPAKSEYRRYKIKTGDDVTDDFAMMHEVLSRRFKRGLEEDNLPDLLVVDGGKGQLNIARAVLKELQVPQVELASLAKSRLKERVGAGEVSEEFEGKRRTPERVFLPGIKNPVLLKLGTAELSLLQRLRDEAHRFAITYHRLLRSKLNLRSGLLDIPGVGPTRAKRLLKHFGSLARVRAAGVEEIAALKGFNPSIAESIKDWLSAPAAEDFEESENEE